jgi:hypothetical protein
MSLEFHRVEFRVIMTERNTDKVIIGERAIAEGAVFPVGLDNLPGSIRQLVDKAMEDKSAAD